MPLIYSENTSSADNQQETLIELIRGSSETKRQTFHTKIKSLSILLGLLYTDGCVSPRHKNSWRIYFVSKSFELANIFRNSLIDVFEIRPERVRISMTSDKKYWKVVLDSKEVGFILVSNFGTFRTLKFSENNYPKARIPSKFLKDNHVLKDFLKSAFTADGGICFYVASKKTNNGEVKWLNRNIFLACSHPDLRTEYFNILTELGIKCVNSSKDNKIKIHSQSEIKKFSDLIGFIDDVKVTNHSLVWNTHSKSNLLHMLIDSYGNPKKYYGYFRKK